MTKISDISFDHLFVNGKLKSYIEFGFVFDVIYGNPNGDPDNDNMPRLDPITMRGIVTDVCIKRKIRNYVMYKMMGKEGFDIFVKDRTILNSLIELAYVSVNGDKAPKNSDEAREFEDRTQAELCKIFADIRWFGAVLSTGKEKGSDNGELDNIEDDETSTEGDKKGNGGKGGKKKYRKVAGRVTGPIQLTFSRSVDPIDPQMHTISRVTVTSEKEYNDNKETMLGHKYTIPYGLYYGYGSISPLQAAKTGFSKEDLSLFFESLLNMFKIDKSAGRGMMTLRKLIVVEHSSPICDDTGAEIFDRMTYQRISEEPAEKFSDYEITFDGKPIDCSDVVTIIPAK